MKNSLLLVSCFLFVFVLTACGQGNYNFPETRTIVHNGVGLGSIIAVVTSWSRNQSVGWAILHGLFSWLYVIYFVLTRQAK